ncbi:MAG: hypothetical protein EP330_20145 [Deltaproteobacteria bacterium]|nr:MAG: hypothetical protein EP330_20145 [Deltaproteobacteria bacterium]
MPLNPTLTEHEQGLEWVISTRPRAELAWVPLGAWLAISFLAVLAAVVLEGRVAEGVRLAPAAAAGIGMLPTALAVRALRAEVPLVLLANHEGLRVSVTGAIASLRAAEEWPAPEGCAWQQGRLTVPWTHPSFAKLRAPQASHFLDGRVRIGLALRIDTWVPVEQGLAFLTRCRRLCLERLGGGTAVNRELHRLERVRSEDTPT